MTDQATALGHDPAPAPRGSRRRMIAHLLVGGLCGLAWATGLRGFMAQVAAQDGSTVTWTGTFAWILAPGVGVGILLGLATYFVHHQGPPKARWLVLSPLLFTAVLVPPVMTLDLDGFLEGLIGGGALGIPALAVAGAYAVAGRRTWGRVICALMAAAVIPIWALTAEAIGGATFALDHPRGLWIALYLWSFLAVLAAGASIPLRIAR